MLKIRNHLGTISITDKYLRSLISDTVESCFGVAGMNSFGAKQGVDVLFNKGNAQNQGVIIRQINNQLIIDLHISVIYGVNVNAITESIAHKVDYVISEQSGISVKSVNVYIDGIVN